MSSPYPTYEDEEQAAYREGGDYHDMSNYSECRRCGSLEGEEYTVDGLCRECMFNAGLVQCTHCGRAFVKEIAKVENGTLFWCPPCVRMQEKGIV